MLFAIKNEKGLYYCGPGNSGSGVWDKQIRKAKIYTSFKMEAKIRDDVRFMEHETFIISLDIVEHGPYNPDLEI